MCQYFTKYTSLYAKEMLQDQDVCTSNFLHTFPILHTTTCNQHLFLIWRDDSLSSLQLSVWSRVSDAYSAHRPHIINQQRFNFELVI